MLTMVCCHCTQQPHGLAQPHQPQQQRRPQQERSCSLGSAARGHAVAATLLTACGSAPDSSQAPVSGRHAFAAASAADTAAAALGAAGFESRSVVLESWPSFMPACCLCGRSSCRRQSLPPQPVVSVSGGDGTWLILRRAPPAPARRRWHGERVCVRLAHATVCIRGWRCVPVTTVCA
jgi:hypothetical protein